MTLTTCGVSNCDVILRRGSVCVRVFSTCRPSAAVRAARRSHTRLWWAWVTCAPADAARYHRPGGVAAAAARRHFGNRAALTCRFRSLAGSVGGKNGDPLISAGRCRERSSSVSPGTSTGGAGRLGLGLLGTGQTVNLRRQRSGIVLSEVAGFSVPSGEKLDFSIVLFCSTSLLDLEGRPLFSRGLDLTAAG